MQHTDCLGLRQLVVSAGLSLIILTVDCQAVYSQNNAVRNAAGVLILQNNRTQQELRETRRELKEIREGLGIESTTSGGAAPKSPNLIGVVLGFALLAVVAVLVFCAFWLAASCERFRKARDFNMFNLCYKCRVLFVTLTLACGGLFPMLGVVNVMGPHFLELGGFVGLAYCSVVTVYGVKRCKDETRIRRLFDAGSEPTVTQATKNPAFQPSDKTSLLSLKRLVRRQATSEAQQSDRSPGTISSQQMNGPCVSIPSVEAAASQTPTTVETGVQWWIRTPDGKQSGPHSKEQLIKAVVAGRVPQGTVTANAPSGPWKQLQLRKQT